MAGMEWLLEMALALLVAATLFHAIRLERALGVLKRDRAALEELVAGFNASTRQAESGIDRLRTAADGAGRQMAKQIESAATLKDDLMFLTERGERLADRMEKLVRAARPLAAEPPRTAVPEPDPEAPRVRSQAERDLLKALRLAR
jgi:chromosome segregation ATPase